MSACLIKITPIDVIGEKVILDDEILINHDQIVKIQKKVALFPLQNVKMFYQEFELTKEQTKNKISEYSSLYDKTHFGITILTFSNNEKIKIIGYSDFSELERTFKRI